MKMPWRVSFCCCRGLTRCHIEGCCQMSSQACLFIQFAGRVYADSKESGLR
jgi:hypothetical protein